MAKDTAPAQDAPPQNTPDVGSAPLDTLRARLAAVAPAVVVKRVEGTVDNLGHVIASWGNKRVSDVADQGRTLDDAECRVLASVLAHHGAA